MNQTELIFYKTEDGPVKNDTVFQDETGWLTQTMMSELFDVNAPAKSKHLGDISSAGEITKEATNSNMETVQQEGKQKISRTKGFNEMVTYILTMPRDRREKGERLQ